MVEILEYNIFTLSLNIGKLQKYLFGNLLKLENERNYMQNVVV